MINDPLQRPTKSIADRTGFPHHVDIFVPPGGLGTQLDAVYEFHTQHGIKLQRGHGKHSPDGAVVRWCFADASLAAAFAKKLTT
jgi:hypothetical protein